MELWKCPLSYNIALKISGGRPSYVTDYDEVQGPKPNLYRTVIRTFWVYWAEATTFMLIGQVSWLLQPLILRYIVLQQASRL